EHRDDTSRSQEVSQGEADDDPEPPCRLGDAHPSPDEVTEDGFEAVIGTLETADFELRVGDNPGEFLVKCIGLPSADYKRVLRGNFQRDDVVHPCKRLGELARLRRLEAHGVRMLVDERTNRVN